jgi:ATP-dependent DNA ligase
MLAKRYSKDGDKILWPAFAQPKFDGHRCIAIVDAKGKCTLWSRNRKQIHSMPHVVAAIEDTNIHNMTIDGELYNHELKDDFNSIVSLVRRKEPDPDNRLISIEEKP